MLKNWGRFSAVQGKNIGHLVPMKEGEKLFVISGYKSVVFVKDSFQFDIKNNHKLWMYVVSSSEDLTVASAWSLIGIIIVNIQLVIY